MKIRVAFIKFGGLATGGTEKWLQTIAANLSKKDFSVDYFYCDAAPYVGSDWKHPDTDPDRLAYMKSKKVNLIKFNVTAKNVTVPTHDWLETNFWDLFHEKEYDIVITGRAGHKEYPYYLITETPIVELVTLPGMVDYQNNIKKTIHISQFQANSWIKAGGSPEKVVVIPLFSEIPPAIKENFREQLGIKNDTFVFGMHQRANDDIYSSVPLDIYSKIENENTAYVLMGGSNLYRQQAVRLKLKNFYSIDTSGDYNKIGKFLSTLNVFAHGRVDGETYSLAIAEAMMYGLPVVSHVAPAMGHVETIGDSGLVANSDDEYLLEMRKLMNNQYYDWRSKNAFHRFDTVLSFNTNIKKLTNILKEVHMKYNETLKLDKMSANEYWDLI